MDNNKELIDNYLSGNLNQETSLQFEKRLAIDKEIQQEVVFQKDVIQGIKQYRKAELKSRLNALDVSVISYSSIWKNLAIAASTLVISGTIALYVTNNDEKSYTERIVITEQKATIIDKEEITIEASQIIESTEPVLVSKALSTQKIITKAEKKDTKKKKTLPTVSFENTLPTLAPTDTDIEIDHDLESEKTISNSSIEFEENGIKVYPENKKNRFHYKYDGKNVLVQIAEYSDDTPAVLINFPEKNEVFLNYKNVFYQLDKNKAWDTLSKHIITNTSLLKALKEKIK